MLELKSDLSQLINFFLKTRQKRKKLILIACSLSLIAALGVFVVLSLPAVGSDNDSITVTAETNEADIAAGIPVKVEAKASGVADETFFFIRLKGDSAALSPLYGKEQTVSVERTDGSPLELTREKTDDGELLSFTLNKSETAEFIINTSVITGIDTEKAELKINASSSDDRESALNQLEDEETAPHLNLVWNAADKSGEEILKQQTITADIYTDSSALTLLQDDSLEIKVTGLLPEGAKAVIYPIEPPENELEGKQVLAAFSLNLLNAQMEEIESIKSAGLTVDINSDKIAPPESSEKNTFTVIEKTEEDSNIIEPIVSAGKLSFTPDDGGEYIIAAAVAAEDNSGGNSGGLPGISIMPLAAGAPLNTVDSRAEGIVINLFDYNASDTWSNHIDSVVYANNSINGARAGVRELLFFGYGTTYNQSGNPPINYYTESAAMQGMVRNTLENGFPRLNTTTGSSLDYLFNTTPIANVKTVHADANYLFTKDADGYFEYDSNKHYARYNTSTKNFTVYSNTYLADSGNPVGFFPFNDYNESRTTINPDDNYYNHHFGMTVSASFVMPPNGIVNGKDMVFEFSGDDDFWLFIDDVLVLDIGGIHNPISGTVNFRTGEVKVGTGSSSSVVAMRNMRPGTSIIGANSTLAQAFAKAGRTFDSSAGSTHTLKLFYLERGGCDSNLKLRLNISSYKSGQLKVMKDITGSNINDYNNREFSTKLYVETSVGSGTYQLFTGDAYYDTGEKITLQTEFSS